MKNACVFAIDDPYVIPFQVFFHSLEETRSLPGDTQVFILHTSTLHPRSIARLESFFSARGRQAIFLDASDRVPGNLPIRPGDHVSPATFYRLFIAEILPPEYSHAVYLDADMLALRSIAPLFSRPVTGLLAAADHCSPADALRLWGGLPGGYFQAGVLAIPLDRWREEKISARFLEVMATRQALIRWWDQDVLNLTVGEAWDRLPVWYNVCEAVTKAAPREQVEQQALLLHFSGSGKPWNTFGGSALTEHWDLAYEAVFGRAFARGSLRPPLHQRFQAAVRSRLAGLLHGRAAR
jgi:lipopolysaccharide biosynthesis glycosyltransferase